MEQFRRMMFILFIFTCLRCMAGSTLALAGPAQGGEAPSFAGEVAIPDLVALLLERNPQLIQVREAWNMAVEDIRIDTSLPDPQIMVTYFPEPIETRLGPQDWNVTLSQQFPFPGTLKLKGEAREIDAAIARLSLDKTARDVVQALLNSCHELIYLQKATAISRKNLELALSVASISENSYGKDKAAFFDVAKAQAQISQIQYDIHLMDELMQTEKATLNLLLDRSPTSEIGRIKPFSPRRIDYTLEDVYALFEKHQETLLIADKQVQKSEILRDLVRLKTLPSFKVGLYYAFIGHPDVGTPPSNAGDDAVGIQFGMSIPLWFGKNQAAKLMAESAVRMAEAKRSEVKNNGRTAISTLWFKMKNASRLMDLYEHEMIPQAEASVTTAQTWHREGGGSLSDLRELQATLYNFELSMARARADYGKAFAGLERLAGVSLDGNDAGKGAEQ